MAKHKTAGVGELLWDMFPEGRQWGGAPGNFARHCSKLGCSSTAISAIGDDDLGRELVDDAFAAGLECIVPVSDYPTGTVKVTLDDSGVPEYEITENVAWDHIPLTDDMEALARYLDAVCFGSLARRSPESRDTIRSLVEQVREGCLKICDINLRQHYYSDELIVDCLEISNVLKVNDEELPVVAGACGCGREDMAEAARDILSKFSLSRVVVTCGEKGSLMVSPDSVSRCDGYPTEVVDTVGAGDSFSAAIAVGLLNGLDPEVINDAACRIASYVCSRPGAVPQLPDELVVLLEKK